MVHGGTKPGRLMESWEEEGPKLVESLAGGSGKVVHVEDMRHGVCKGTEI